MAYVFNYAWCESSDKYYQTYDVTLLDIVTQSIYVL